MHRSNHVVLRTQQSSFAVGWERLQRKVRCGSKAKQNGKKGNNDKEKLPLRSSTDFNLSPSIFWLRLKILEKGMEKDYKSRAEDYGKE